MKPVYIIFEHYEDVKCEKTHGEKGSQYQCGGKIRCSRIVRFVTTDLDLAILFTKNKPSWGYQKETLWTNW